MVPEKFIITQLQLFTSKETQFNWIQFVREAEYLSYKTLQEENDRIGKRIEAIMITLIVSVSFTYAEDTKNTSNLYVNGITYFQKSSQEERTITQ